MAPLDNEDVVVEFLKEQADLQYHSQVVRPWGSFVLSVSLNGKTMMVERLFGAGWTMERAAAMIILGEIGRDPIPPQFIEFFGQERLNALLHKLNTRDIKLLPSAT